MLHPLTELIQAANQSEEMPDVLADPLTGEDAFDVRYVRTDGWRGFYETTAREGSGWTKVDEGWMTGDYPDAPLESRASSVQAKVERLAEEADVVIVFAPSSNVFSTIYDVYVREEGS
jgi:hypothetical protein